MYYKYNGNLEKNDLSIIKCYVKVYTNILQKTISVWQMFNVQFRIYKEDHVAPSNAPPENYKIILNFHLLSNKKDIKCKKKSIRTHKWNVLK